MSCYGNFSESDIYERKVNRDLGIPEKRDTASTIAFVDFMSTICGSKDVEHEWWEIKGADEL